MRAPSPDPRYHHYVQHALHGFFDSLRHDLILTKLPAEVLAQPPPGQRPRESGNGSSGSGRSSNSGDAKANTSIALAERVGITMCVLGNIDTAANRALTTGLVPDFLVRHPPAHAAAAIVNGGLRQRREVCWPWHECAPVLALNFLAPQWTGALVRALSVKSA